MRLSGHPAIGSTMTKTATVIFLSAACMVGAADRWFQLTTIVTNVTPARLLHEAVTGGDVDEVRKLLDSGVSPNARWLTRRAYCQGPKDTWPTPLHLAASEGKQDIVALLIAKGADLNSRCRGKFDKPGLTPLHEAIRGKHEDVTLSTVKCNESDLL